MHMHMCEPPLNIPQRSSKPPFPMLPDGQEGVLTNLFTIIQGSHLGSVPETHHNKKVCAVLSDIYLDTKLVVIPLSHAEVTPSSLPITHRSYPSPAKVSPPPPLDTPPLPSVLSQRSPSPHTLKLHPPHCDIHPYIHISIHISIYPSIYTSIQKVRHITSF